MQFLTNQFGPGIFTLADCFRSLNRLVDEDYYPSCYEFMMHELARSNYPIRDFLNDKKMIDDFRKRIYLPGMQESLMKKMIKTHSKKFKIIEVTEEEDQNNKIDLKITPIGSNDNNFVIIQIKGKMPPQTIIERENKKQFSAYGKTAAYVIVGFRPENPERPWFEYRGRTYKLEELDIMLEQIWRDKN